MALLLTSKACDGTEVSYLTFLESCLTLNLGEGHEGIVTHIEAFKALGMF
jgi:hypothetical protein